jgi:hypothetical protein
LIKYKHANVSELGIMEECQKQYHNFSFMSAILPENLSHAERGFFSSATLPSEVSSPLLERKNKMKSMFSSA